MLIIGLIAGALARLLVPGRDPMGIGGTILLGVIGSFVGGFIGWALFGKDLAEGTPAVGPDRLHRRRCDRPAGVPRHERAPTDPPLSRRKFVGPADRSCAHQRYDGVTPWRDPVVAWRGPSASARTSGAGMGTVPTTTVDGGIGATPQHKETRDG
ncbi:MAG: GlsB/YeaQ/YmgE family stress response membrane protein [Ilumatobacteraceae bacterium]